MTFDSPVRGEEPVFVVPDDLSFGPAEIPADQNALLRLVEELPTPTAQESKWIREALARSRDEGKLIEDEAYLDDLRKHHALAEELLKPPARFSAKVGSSVNFSVLLRLQNEAQILALQSSLRGDRQALDRYTGNLFAWSRLMRDAYPRLIDCLVVDGMWRTAFNCLLQDWERGPDQEARLAEIRKIHQANRISSEYVERIVKGELRWLIESGGLKEVLRSMPADEPLIIGLKSPFDRLLVRELLELPYDEKAELDRMVANERQILRDLRSGKSLDSWDAWRIPESKLTLEDYRKRSNGLGDLCFEQDGSNFARWLYGSVLSADPLLECGFAWLEREKDGKGLLPEVPGSPVDGMPLRLDPALRLIRSRDEKTAIPPKEGPAAIGFKSAISGTLRMPQWRK